MEAAGGAARDAEEEVDARIRRSSGPAGFHGGDTYRNYVRGEGALYGMIEISLWIKLGHLQEFSGTHLTFSACLAAMEWWNFFDGHKGDQNQRLAISAGMMNQACNFSFKSGTYAFLNTHHGDILVIQLMDLKFLGAVPRVLVSPRGHKHATPTGAKARRGKKALKVKISLASPAKKIKKPCKKKGTKKKGTVAGRIGRKCTLARDSKGRFLPRESKGEDIGESATETEVDYNRFMNFQAPDFATILSILKGWKGMKHCNKIRRLKDPDFVPLMNVMSNTGHVTDDDGHYDVLKVLMQADGWSA
uniref:Uncharacterized protein n=1 Tax=Oryza punctata TaxID=4537 RepID=A0A0E0MPP2_ORYPU